MQVPMSDLRKALQPIFFPVEKIAWADHMPEWDYANGLSHLILARPKGRKPIVINSCSKDYSLVPNEELLSPLIDQLESNYTVECEPSHYGYSKFYINMAFKDKAYFIGGKGKKDMLFPMIRINNSYDGSVKYSYSGRILRVHCDNGLCLPEGDEISMEPRMHTGHLDKTAVDDTIGFIQEFLDGAKDLVQGYNVLTQKKYTPGELLQRIEQIAKATDFSKKKMEAVAERVSKEVNDGFDRNDWIIYNAFNYVVYDKTNSEMKDHKRDKLDFKLLEYITDSI